MTTLIHSSFHTQAQPQNPLLKNGYIPYFYFFA